MNMIIFLILSLILTAEVASLSTGRLFLIQKILKYYAVKRWCKLNISDSWSYKIDFLTLGRCEAFIDLQKDHPGKNYKENRCMVIKFRGLKVTHDLAIRDMRRYDQNYDKEMLSKLRDEKIGKICE